MKTIFTIIIIFSLRVLYSQEDEVAYFWDGSSAICYPDWDYEFKKTKNKDLIKNEDGFLVQNHIPLSYMYTRDPNINYPNLEKREVGIPQKFTFYYNVNLGESQIVVFDCDQRLRSYNILKVEVSKKEIIIRSENETDTSTIYISVKNKPSFKEIRISKLEGDEETLVNKKVRVFELKR